MEWDAITQTGAWTPGVERANAADRWIGVPRTRAQNRDTASQPAGCTKGGCKPCDAINT